MNSLQERVDRLSVSVTQLDPKEEEREFLQKIVDSLLYGLYQMWLSFVNIGTEDIFIYYLQLADVAL